MLNFVVKSIILIAIILIQTFNSTMALAADSYELALQSYHDQQYQEAYIHLKNSIQDAPDHLPSKVLMGEVLLQKGYVLDAIEEFEESIQLGADANLIGASLAEAYVASGNYLAVLNLDPQEFSDEIAAHIYLFQARAHDHLDREKEAEVAFSQAMGIRPDSIRILNSYAEFLIYQSNFNKAESVIDKSFSLDQTDNRTIHLKGQFADAQGNIKGALKYYEAALKAAPQDPVIMRSVALARFKLRDFSAVLELLQKILQQSPNDPLVLFLKARTQHNLGLSQQADETLDELSNKLSVLVGKDAKINSQVSLLKGLTSFIKGNYSDSAIFIENYLLSAENDEKSLGILALTYIKSNQTRNAENLLESNLATVKSSGYLASLLCQIYMDKKRFFLCANLLNEMNQSTNTDPLVYATKIKLEHNKGNALKALDLFNTFYQPPFSTAQQILRVRLLLANDQLDNALAITDELIADSERDPAMLILRTEILLSQDQLPEITNLLDEISQLVPQNEQLKFLKAKYYIKKSAFTDAASILNQLVEINPSHEDGHLLLASTLDKMGEQEKAIQLLLKYQKSNNSVKIREAIANLQIKLGFIDEAIAVVDSLHREQMNNPKYIVSKASLLIKTNQFVKAKHEIFSLEQLLPINQQNVSLILNLKRQIEDYEGAIWYLKEIAKHQELTQSQQLEYVRFLMLTKEFDQAEIILQEVLVKDNNNLASLYLAAELNNNKQNKDKAFNYYLRGFESSKGSLLFANGLFRMASQGVSTERFKQVLRDWRYVNTEQQHKLQFLLAQLLIKQNERDEAKKYYLNYITSKLPENREEALFQLAQLSYDQPKIALQYAKEAVSLSPNEPEIVSEYGWLLSLNGEYDAALYNLRKANVLASGEGQTLYRMGYSLYQLGRCDAAKQELLTAVDKGGNFAEKATAKKLLTQIEQQKCKQVSG